MISKIQLIKSGLSVSAAGVGLSRIHHLYFEWDRRRFIDAAIAEGFTHFDVARLYGDGLAERSIGRALGSRRSNLTIASKFGLLPTDWLGGLGFPARFVWAARPTLRRLGVSKWARRSFTIETFQRSLATSLRHLRTDYLDILFLHEPQLHDVTDDLVGALEAEKQRGKIRHLGLAGSNLGPILQRYSTNFAVIQSPEREWDDSVVPDISFGIFSALPKIPTQQDEINAIIRRALARRPHGAILVGTTKIKHLKQMAIVLSDGAS